MHDLAINKKLVEEEMGAMKQWIKLLRVKHYVKNGLVFVPLFFSMQLTWENVVRTSIGFVLFSIAASAIYIFNDLKDIEKDRIHPIKRNRPLAKGTISPLAASCVAVILSLIAIVGTFFLNIVSCALLVVYLVLNFLYSYKLKSVPLVDICILATGYVLRIFYGAYLSNIIVSGLLYLTVLSAALFMGLGKRRGELQKVEDIKNARQVLKYYTYDFLDKNMYVQMGLTTAFYSMWCINTAPYGQRVLITVPILVFIMLRYSMVLEKDSDGDPVEVVSSDRILQFLSIIFVISLIVILYMYGVAI